MNQIDTNFTKATAANPPKYLRAFALYGNPPVEIKIWMNKVLDQAGLTVKEREIIGLVLQGLTTQDIGNRIGNKEKTVKHHLHMIFKKFDVSSRAQLFAEIFDL